MSRSAHPAGPRHADVLPEGHYSAPPADLNALDPKVWSQTVTRDARRGRHRRRDRRHRGSPRSSAPPPTSSTRPTSAPACRAWRTAFGHGRRRLLRREGVPVPGRRALAARGGAEPRRLLRRRAGHRARPPGCPPSASPSTATTSPPTRSDRAVEAGVGRIVLDSFQEIVRVAHIAQCARQAAARADPGHRRRRGAHPRVHRHRARGPEVRHRAGRRAGRGGRAAGARSSTASNSSASTRTSGRRSSTCPASRSPPTASCGCSPTSATSTASSCPRSTSAAVSASRTPATTTPASRTRSPRRSARSSPVSARPRSCARPASPSSRGAPSSGPTAFTLYEVGTIKPLDGLRTYVSVDGGMSDNIRTALYDAEYSVALVSRTSDAEPMLVARRRQALRER